MATQKKYRVRSLQPLTIEEITRLLNMCPKHTFAGQRAYAMMVFMWRTQVRVSEMLAMELNDLDLDKGTARVQHGKGDKYRVVAFDQRAIDVVKDWLEIRKRYGLEQCPLLFPTQNGTRQTRRHVCRKMHILKEKCGISKRVFPHALRHAGAMELQEEGIELRHIQTQLGHAKVSTTAIYLQRLNPAPAIEQIRKRVW